MINRLRTLFGSPRTATNTAVDDTAPGREELEKKIEFYEAIINNLPNDLVVFDTSHTYVLINKTAIRDPELRRFMLRKTDFDYCEYKKMPKSIALQRREKFNYVMENRTSYNWEEAKEVNGKREVVSRTMRPVLDDDGAIRYVLGYGMDISALRSAQASLEELNRHLQEQVAERTRELTDSNQSLERFAWSVSHDLRGPLRHISAYTSLLKKSLERQTSSDQAEYLDYVVTAAKKMDLQIDGLLKLSRISSGRLDTEWFDMQPLFEEAVSIYSSYYSAPQIDCEIRAAVQVRADRHLMSTVIENIISNAIKYSMPTGAVHLRVSYALGDGEIIFAVRDHGIGFDMQHYGRLFGVFQRLHSHQEVEGLGIGLSHVRQIIDKHGGRIWAESRVNEGTVFYFALPHQQRGVG